MENERTEDFNLHVPTDIRSGEDRLDELPAVLDQFGKSTLLACGDGSIKRNGLYQQITDLVQENGYTLTELSGVEPNPRIGTVRKGIESCRENQIDAILAVGDGSTINCSKAIIAGFYLEGDIWIVITAGGGYTGPALPIMTILTLAATGSEMSAGTIVSSLETNQKLNFDGSNMVSRVSFLGPANIFTVPQNQTATGSADIFSHLIEDYFSISIDTDVQDFVPEGLVQMAIKNCPIALEDPENYDAHASLMWAGNLTLNGLARRDKQGAWSCHLVEHELSAFYGITHGISLAILASRWMSYVLSERAINKFVQFARDARGIVEQGEEVAAKKGIQVLYDYFAACNILMTLPRVGVEVGKSEEVVQQAVAHSAIAEKAYIPSDIADTVTIYKDCLAESQFV